MIVKIDKSFVKDISGITDRKLKEKVANYIELLQEAGKITDLKNVKKLKGYHSYYRIKIGNYRIGLVIENETIELIRFLHRRDIYTFFPR